MKISTRQLLKQRRELERDYVSYLRRGNPSRREFLRYSAWAAAIFGAAGIAVLPTSASAAAVSKHDLAARQDGIVLNISHTAASELPFITAKATEYLAANPQITDIVFDTFTYNEGFQKQSLALSQGGTVYDILMVDEPWLPSYSEFGYVHELREQFAADTDPDYNWDGFHQAGLDMGRWKGEQFGIPYVSNTLNLIYRKDLYEEAGLPLPTHETTWQEWEQALNVLHQPDQHQWGFASYHLGGDLNTADWMAMAHSWLPYPQNQFWNPETWEPQMNQPFGAESLEYYIYLMENYSMPGPLSVDFSVLFGDYLQGHTAQMVMWASANSTIENPETSMVAGKNGWTIPPRGINGQAASHRGFWALMVSANSVAPVEAWKFAEYLTNPVVSRDYAMQGLLTCRSELLVDPAVNENFPYYSQTLENLDAIAQSHAYRPRLPQVAQLMDSVNRQVARAQAREITAEEAVNAMARDSERLLRGWGYLQG